MMLLRKKGLACFLAAATAMAFPAVSGFAADPDPSQTPGGGYSGGVYLGTDRKD